MADLSRKRIITCAITGAIHTPTMSDALPYTADDIAAQAIAAAEAGASILHLHARRPADGGVSINPDHFAAFLPRIKQATGAVINLSTGGSLTNTIEDRLAPALRFSPEMCSLNMGSMNFAFHPLAKRYDTWKFDWEQDYVANSDTFIFRNTFRDIANVAHTLGPHGIKFEHECYDVGHLYNLKFCMDSGLFKAPVFIPSNVTRRWLSAWAISSQTAGCDVGKVCPIGTKPLQSLSKCSSAQHRNTSCPPTTKPSPATW